MKFGYCSINIRHSELNIRRKKAYVKFRYLDINQKILTCSASKKLTCKGRKEFFMPPCSDQWLSWAAQIACVFEVLAEKPGNVTRTRDCVGLSLEQFLVSATGIGPAFNSPSTSSVGEMIRDGVDFTKTLTGVNTNVGILLMLAPLAKAAALGCGSVEDLRRSLRCVLDELTVHDAQDAYSAILKAAPHGLDEVDEGDVRNSSIDMTLREAMELAKDRDNLASQYVTDFSLVFDMGYSELKRLFDEGRPLSMAIVQTYLTILASVPDTDIARKSDLETARRISMKALEVVELGGVFTEKGMRAVERFDELVRDEQRLFNPGTTADLMAGSLFVFLVCEATPETIPDILARW